MEKESISTVKEITTSLNSALYKRITNPLIGSFILTWIIWNWKLLFYSFNLDPDVSIPSHILFIQNNYLTNYWISIIGPLVSALFITLGFPYLNIEITAIIERARKRLINKRTKIRDEVYPSIDEHIILLEKYRSLKSTISDLEKTLRNEQVNFEEIEKKYTAEIGRLNKKINSHIQIEDDHEKTLAKLTDSINESREAQENLKKFNALKLKVLIYYKDSLHFRTIHDNSEKFFLSDLGPYLITLIFIFVNRTPKKSLTEYIHPDILNKYIANGLISEGNNFKFIGDSWNYINFLVREFDRLFNIGYSPVISTIKNISIKQLLIDFDIKINNDSLETFDKAFKKNTYSLTRINPIL